MTIESVGRKGPKPTAEHGLPAGRHGRRPQPDARTPQGVRPKPQPPGTAAGKGQAQASEQAQSGRPRGAEKPEGHEARVERSLYDGGSPSANRLGPAKAMRARDVSRPRE